MPMPFAGPNFNIPPPNMWPPMGMPGQMPGFYPPGGPANQPVAGQTPAMAWGQTPVYPDRYGGAFCALPFGEAWVLPTAAQFAAMYTEFDFVRHFNRQGMLPVFSGKVLDYPAWQATFKHNVHVQNVDVMWKCIAFDQYVTEDVRTQLFGGLGTGANEYLLRTRRMDEKFGGKQRQMISMMKQLECLKNIDKSPGALQQATFTLQHIIHTPYWTARGEEMVGMLMPKLPTSMKKSFATL